MRTSADELELWRQMVEKMVEKMVEQIPWSKQEHHWKHSV